MKAERRHELKDNDLLHILHQTRDYLNENGGRVGLALVVVIVGATALSLGVRSNTAASEDSWMRKSELVYSDVEKGRESLATLSTLVAQSTDDAFVLSALIEQGQQALRLCQEVPFPPDEDFNNLAKNTFTELRKRFPDNALATGAALTGLATVEANAFVFDSDPAHKEKAKALLTEARDAKALSGLPFQRIAIERLNHLEQTFTPVITVAPEMVIENDVEGESETEGDAAGVDTP
jgi:hypothetical protein